VKQSRRFVNLRQSGVAVINAAPKGAKYDSQGQALSAAKRVAPGTKRNDREALKERNNDH